MYSHVNDYNNEELAHKMSFLKDPFMSLSVRNQQHKVKMEFSNENYTFFVDLHNKDYLTSGEIIEMPVYVSKKKRTITENKKYVVGYVKAK